MRGVPRLGAGSGELRYWVNQIEKGFRFNSSAALPPAAEQIIQKKVQTKEQEVLRCYESLKKRWIDLKNSAVESSNNAALSQELRGVSDKFDALVEKTKAAYESLDRKINALAITYAQSIANADACPKPLKKWR